ncbi:hypothetical protein EII19_07475 [Comamonadaceae bacterium OH2310_COT-174]|nr:hypothetical protein EII19_07475 [Comamonadaceae bacterium OH2310_COT-174]
MSSALAAAIEHAYCVFSACPPPAGPLDVCMPCCVEPEMEEQLRRLPLRQLTPKHLYEYNNSAKNDVQSIAEVGYFLPRLLELIAQGKEVHHSTELYLDRLGRCPADSLSPEQWQAVQAVAQAMWAQSLNRYPWENESTQIGYTLFDTLLMWHKGGLDIQPLLDLWLHTDTPQATLQYADSAWFGYWDEGCISNAFADDQPEYQQRMTAWLSDEAHCLTFARRLLVLDLARAPDVDKWRWGDYFTPEQRTQCLIDAMTQGLSDDALRQLLN